MLLKVAFPFMEILKIFSKYFTTEKLHPTAVIFSAAEKPSPLLHHISRPDIKN